MRQYRIGECKEVKKSTVILLLIFCLGAGFRFYSLGDKNLWLDEASSVYYAERLIPSMVEKLIDGQYENSQQIILEWIESEPAQPPLYYIFLNFWMVVGRDEVTVRLLSVLAGIISIPVLYRLAKTLFNERVGLLSALLLAISPLHLLYSQEARMYPFITLFVLVSTFCMIGFLKTDRWIWRIGYVLCAAINLYMQYITVFALIFQNLIVLIFVWRQRDKRRLLIWLVMQVCVLLLFAPWTPFAIYQVFGKGDGFNGQYIFPIELPISLFRVFSMGRFYWEIPLGVSIVGVLGFLVFFLYGVLASESNDALKKRPWWRISQEVTFCLIYLFSAGLGAFLLYPIKPDSPKPALFGLPAFYILVARGIEQISRHNRARLSIIVAFITLVLLFPIINVYQREASEDWEGLVDYILSESQPDDVVALHAFYIHKPFNYYVAERVPPYAELVEVDYPLQDIPVMVQRMAQGHRRLWLVASRMTYVDPNWAVKKYLDEHYRLLEEKNFLGMDGVFLYELQE